MTTATPSLLSVLPSRAEFIRDHLAFRLMGAGEIPTKYNSHAGPEVSWTTFEYDLNVRVLADGSLLDLNTGRPMDLRWFRWAPVATDTGVRHGPLQAPGEFA